ncbi:DNA polymerase III subunit delta' [Serpentinicella sp. ANB-PHB4]|uniref:DNA polymerase III subunit delta' n=1 Tax=Serpentinicella sp. ANB-PHB4 TaxID=3074076 RepID=UPI00285E6ECB|nr:DNA polymerase III subunit delta' [Serpentinicella sp. ANB-PHB4]MDR5659220.1 DNA polymerase III subunit delta' [Serpentinicella sp. ANB-PHB4]
MAFEEILGQENAVEILKKAIEKKRIAHAYLIEGLSGIGKKKLATIFAQGILCVDETNKPCNHCISCRKFKDSNHPEFYKIEKEGSIKIDDIREMQKQIHIKPYEGIRKVYLITNVEKMTVQAQNALLKTLEEPPAYAVIILTSDNTKSLLPTIVSRCQIIKLKPQRITEIKEYLIKIHDIEEKTASMIAAFSNGLVGKAIKLTNNNHFKQLRNKVIEISTKALRENTINILKEIHFFEEEKEHIDEILDLIISWYRDLLIYKETETVGLLMNIDHIEMIRKYAKEVTFNQLKSVIYLVEEKKKQLKSNINYNLGIETMLIELETIFKD